MFVYIHVSVAPAPASTPLLFLFLLPLGVREGFFVEAQHELEAAQNILSTPSSAVVVSLISTSTIASARVCL